MSLFSINYTFRFFSSFSKTKIHLFVLTQAFYRKYCCSCREKFVSFDVFVFKSHEKRILTSSHLGRGTHVPRSGYTCLSVGIRTSLGRGTMTLCALSGQTHQTFYLLIYRYWRCILLNINYLYLLMSKIFCILVRNN